MRKIISLAVAAAVLSGASSLANAASFNFAVGQTSDSTMTYRFGAQFDFGRSWFASDVGRLTGYWDGAYTYWDGDEKSSNHSVSLTPVFVYEFAGDTFKPYVEAGVGMALFSSTELENNNLSTAFQFEDLLGAGVRFSGQEVGIRATHYSNAGIKNPNDGVESYAVHYSLSF